MWVQRIVTESVASVVLCWFDCAALERCKIGSREHLFLVHKRCTMQRQGTIAGLIQPGLCNL